MERGAWRATVHGVTRVGHNLATKPPQPPMLDLKSSFKNNNKKVVYFNEIPKTEKFWFLTNTFQEKI